ncbi:hypothetical protein BHE74_00036559 [Ensete ventricosum]|nr:hypothetical protein BHE74_00036559 [Ensete ventricosum]RZS04441.1 hypothetical protein BHM03_00034747 [Ensete ventricosum]
MQAATALCDRQPPCQGAGTPATGTVAPTGGRASPGRQPLAGWPLPAGPCGLAIADRARRWPPLAGSCPCGRPPFAGGLAVADHPLQVARPWPAAPVGGLAVASHLCMQRACMWSPLPRRQRLLLLSIAATSAYNSST